MKNKKSNIRSRELMIETLIPNSIIDETLAANYRNPKNDFFREFGEIINENEVDTYLDFLTNPISSN